MISRATLVLANHRPECIDPAKQLMQLHDAVILEEPPDERFRPMLAGELSIESYLETLDLEYPLFSRRMSQTLREIHSGGKKLFQVEPFLEKLIQIHQRFADGGRPADLEKGTDIHAVYMAERNATAALLGFYKVSLRGSFEAAVAAVKRFARADAQRFWLRDRMRADAIAEILAGPGTYYIEAGQIHYPLWLELKRRLPTAYPLAVKFLMSDAVRKMGARGHLFGPGDLLTLLYRFHPDRNIGKEDLLAARALVYNKLIAKEEITDSGDAFPHTRDELQTAATVRNLTLADCRQLFPLIRRASTDAARKAVRHYLKQRSPNSQARSQ